MGSFTLSLSVVPGETLTVLVGGGGGGATDSRPGAGGYGGGAAGGRGEWWTAGSAADPVFVPDARTTYFDVNVTAGDEWCLRDVDIYVRISHPCASQLSISVVGPGPVSGDGNFRDPVAASWPVLLHAPDANAEACGRLDPPFSTQDALDDFGYKGDPGMLFDDDARVDVRAPDANPYGGTFRPVDALAEFVTRFAEFARPA